MGVGPSANGDREIRFSDLRAAFAHLAKSPPPTDNERDVQHTLNLLESAFEGPLKDNTTFSSDQIVELFRDLLCGDTLFNPYYDFTRDALKPFEHAQRKKALELLRSLMPDIAEILNIREKDQRTLYNLIPDRSKVSKLEFASARFIDLNDVEVGRAYLEQVDELARNMTNYLRDRCGDSITIAERAQGRPPAIGWRRITATGAIAVAIDNTSIFIRTPFGEFPVCSASYGLDNQIVKDLIDDFSLLRIENPPWGDRRGKALPLLFVASKDCQQEDLPLAFRCIPHPTDLEAIELSRLWNKVKPSGRCALGEEHVLRGSLEENLLELERLAEFRPDEDERVRVFREHMALGLPVEDSVKNFIAEQDRQIKIGMLEALNSCRVILLDFPEFGDEVARWLTAELPQKPVDTYKTPIEVSFKIITALKCIGPVNPKGMLGPLGRALELFSDPTEVLQLIALYGREAYELKEKLQDVLKKAHRADNPELIFEANRALLRVYPYGAS